MKSETQGALRVPGKRVAMIIVLVAAIVGAAYFALLYALTMRAQHAAVEIVALSLYEHCTPLGAPGPQGQCGVDPEIVQRLLAGRTCPVWFDKTLPIQAVPYGKKLRVSCAETTIDI